MVVPPLPRPVVGQDAVGHILGLVILVHGGVEGHLLPRRARRPQLLALAALVVLDDCVGRRQDVFGGAVVLLQPDGAAALILVLKRQDILDGGAPEPIDGLVIVAHHADVLMSPRQQGGQQILQVVGVLVLVDENIAELPLVISTHALVLLQQANGVEQNIVEVQCPGVPQLFLVGGIQPGHLLQAEVPAFGALLFKVRRQLQLVLGLGDDRQHGPGRELLVVHPLLLQAVLHDPDGIVSVVDGEGGGEAQLFNVPAQDAHAGGVEGGGPHIPGFGAQGPLQAVLQLPGGLVGEGDGDDGPGGGGLHGAQAIRPELFLRGRVGEVALQEGQILLRHPVGHLGGVGAPAIANEVGHPVDEHRGLAGACTGQQQQRALGTQHRLLLLLVQLGVIQGDSRPPGAAELQLLFMGQHGISPFRQVELS